MVELPRPEQAEEASSSRMPSVSAGEEVAEALARLGEAACLDGRYEQAKTYFERGLALVAGARGDSAEKLLMLEGLGTAALALDDEVGAGECFRECLRLARGMGDALILRVTLQNMGAVMLEREHYDEAEAYFREGLELATRSNDHGGISAMLQGLGKAAGVRGWYWQAEHWLIRALETAGRSGRPRETSAMLAALGWAIYYGAIDYGRAEDCFREGLTLARDCKDHGAISFRLHGVGAMALAQRDFTRAEECFQEGLALARRGQGRHVVAARYRGLGKVALGRRDLAAAEAYFRAGLNNARGTPHRSEAIALLQGLGRALLDQGDSSGAKASITESLTLIPEGRDPRIVGVGCCILGWIAVEEGDGPRAEYCFSEAITAADSREPDLRAVDLRASALFGLAQVAAGQGRSVKARDEGRTALALLELIGHHPCATACTVSAEKIVQSLRLLD